VELGVAIGDGVGVSVGVGRGGCVGWPVGLTEWIGTDACVAVGEGVGFGVAVGIGIAPKTNGLTLVEALKFPAPSAFLT
jgi:hypothetical protein